MNRDPMVFTDAITLIGYVRNNPLNRVDPSGRICRVPSRTIADVPLADFWVGWVPTRTVHTSYNEIPVSYEVPEDFLGFDPYFANYYYSGGRSFVLSEWGLLDDFQRRMRSSTETFNQDLMDLAESQLASVPCTDNESVTVSLGARNIPYEFATAFGLSYLWEPNFALGGNRRADSFTARGTCVMSCSTEDGLMTFLVGKQNVYTISCQSTFVLTDAFTDPFDPFDLVEGEVDNYGTPYPILGSWSEGWIGIVGRKCGATSGGDCVTELQ